MDVDLPSGDISRAVFYRYLMSSLHQALLPLRAPGSRRYDIDAHIRMILI